MPANLDELVAGLSRLTPTYWVKRKRPEMQFDGGREYLVELYNDFCQEQCCMKGTQVGETERFVSRAMHFMEEWRYSVLYVLPNQSNASDFSQTRVNPVIRNAPTLRSRFQNVDNVGLKMMGDQALYIRGSQAEADLTSIPVEVVMIDEFDRCNRENVRLAEDRKSGKKRWFVFKASTPTTKGKGIDLEYSLSDQRKYLLECPTCKEARPITWKSIDWKESAPETATWRCAACGMPWSIEQKLAIQASGIWQPHNPGARVHGYHIPRLLSIMRTPEEHVREYLKAQLEGETEMANFHNSVLGEPYEAEGTTISAEMIHEAILCSGGYRMYSSAEENGKPMEGIAMGVDVGGSQHYLIGQVKEGGELKLLRAGRASSLREIIGLVKKYNVSSIVIDANPERQMAREVQGEINSLPGRFKDCWLAFYPEMKGPIRWNADEGTVDIQRTEALDAVVAIFRNNKILIPVDIPDEFKLHLRSIVRVNKEDPRTGNLIGRWEDTGADHYAHALVYLMTAALRASTGQSRLGVYVF